MSRHRTLLLCVIIFATALLSACATTAELQPFTTDGCSRFPDRDLINHKDWCGCCVLHDLAYWRGGTEQQRLEADQALKECVARTTGDAKLAQTMYIGVRAGGGPDFYTPYRWGYGWPYGRGYEPLTEQEHEALDKLEREYRNIDPGLSCPP